MEYNDNSSIEIMSYLIKKLESSYSSILKFNNLLDSFDTSETFFTLQKDLKLLFKDLLENFNQGIFAIKALTNQNKKILEEIKLKDFENKEILEQINNIKNENKKLKSQIIKIKVKDTKENVEINEENERNERNEIKRDKNTVIQKEENNINNKYELAQLSNVKDIMDNMKKKKMKLKMAIQQRLANNQERDNSDKDDY